MLGHRCCLVNKSWRGFVLRQACRCAAQLSCAVFSATLPQPPHVVRARAARGVSTTNPCACAWLRCTIQFAGNAWQDHCRLGAARRLQDLHGHQTGHKSMGQCVQGASAPHRKAFPSLCPDRHPPGRAASRKPSCVSQSHASSIPPVKRYLAWPRDMAPTQCSAHACQPFVEGGRGGGGFRWQLRGARCPSTNTGLPLCLGMLRSVPCHPCRRRVC